MKQKTPHDRFEALASSFTRWVGSSSSIVAHTIFFLLCLISPVFGIKLEAMLLFLTTVVSLEAIYLAILIQYTVNKNTENLVEVGKDIDEIQEDIDEIQEDVDEIQEDVDEIQEDVDEIQEDIDEIQDDVDEIEVGESHEEVRDEHIRQTVERIQQTLETIIKDINNLKTKK